MKLAKVEWSSKMDRYLNLLSFVLVFGLGRYLNLYKRTHLPHGALIMLIVLLNTIIIGVAAATNSAVLFRWR